MKGWPQGLRALVCDDGDAERRIMCRLLREGGITAEAVADVAAAEAALAAGRPDVLLLDLHMGPPSGLDLLAAVRRSPQTLLLPVICVTGDARPATLEAAFEAGADDFLAKPYTPEELVCRVRVAVRRRRVLGSVSPLTGLPGNVVLTTTIEARLAAGEPFALAHVDIDHFKAYNDHYGYVRGDEAIRRLGGVLAGRAGDGIFLAHIGGDDFAVVGGVEEVVRACEAVCADYAAVVPELYDEEDAGRGGIVAVSRSGAVGFHPLLTLSIGVAVHAERRYDAPAAMADVAAECRGEAKRQAGSSIVVDRRGAGVGRRLEARATG